MSCYPEPHSHIRDKIKVVFDLLNYVTKKELLHAIDIDTFDLAAKKDFIALKVEVGKLDINKLTNALTSLNDSKTTVDDLDVGKKTFSVGSKKLSDVVNNEVIKNRKYNTLKTKINSLEKTIPDATTLAHINQYNTDKLNLEKNNTKYGGLGTTTVLNTKISEAENKMPNTNNSVTTTILNTEIR